jgi:hypothetical protein
MRQALGGMLWTKQFYQFIQKEWISGDPAQPAPPSERQYVRNRVCRQITYVLGLCLMRYIGVASSSHRRRSINAGQVGAFLTFRWLSLIVFRWEYPFFAAWDTAFHCLPLAVVDPAFAKKQLDLLTREWYMKPDGQIPAYEWNFGDVNPPVHAW